MSLEINSFSNKIRTFDITALSIPIVYNYFGHHDPNGLMYILQEDKDYVREKALNNFNNKDEKGDPLPIPTDEVQPLIIRANVGETVLINFEHNENRRLSINMPGIQYKNIKSDGANAGFNEDSTVGPNEKITYEYIADREGIFYFSDLGDARGSQEGTNVHGLFGALIVQAKDSTWTDPVDGYNLRSGLFADVHNPCKASFREYGVFFHDELEVVDRFGGEILDPYTGQPMALTAISYRSDPLNFRAHEFLPPTDKGFKCCNPCNPRDSIDIVDIQHPDHNLLQGEDVSMSSWPYGDPATFIPRAYKGDPSKFRIINGAILETHVFHLHDHQWKLDSDDPDSTIIDSQSFSPQESYTLDILFGAGSLVGAIGDHIWHCHLYPHFHDGMWSLWRIFDRLETGHDVIVENGVVIPALYPDGSYKKALQPLPDRDLPPKKTLCNPGYPNFINGEFKERAKQPPLGIINENGTNKICPKYLEKSNFDENPTSGALYTQPCLDNQEYKCKCKCHNLKPDVIFELFVLQAKIVYNNFGWHDPYGRFYATKEQIEDYAGCKLTLNNREILAERYVKAIEDGYIDIEPLVIRANAGDCIEVRTTNLLPEILPGTPFQLPTLTDNVSFHIHLVKFDVVTSDGGANGYNNSSSAFYGETLVERFFANEELKTCFFHDHMYPNSHQQHGLFAALIIEPKGSTYHDPKTGHKIKYGTKAIIKTPSGRVFREFGLFVQDFTLLFDKDGNPLNPPPFSGSNDDPGVMGISYKSEPIGERLKSSNKNPLSKDPAYVFDSNIHGDPVTPILETYPGDEIVIRLVDGAQEEQHTFNINGMKWKREITDKKSPLVQSQTLGISEAFNLRITDDYKAGDYIYYFGGQDDFWLGLWGIIRAYKYNTNGLLPLSYFNLCKCKIYHDNHKKLEHPHNKNKDVNNCDKITREFHIAAIQKDLIYNKFKDHDPYGLLFVPYEHKDHIINGNMEPIPLILRANKGDHIKITLTNCFDTPIPYLEYPGVPVDVEITPSMRVGISTQFLKFDPVTSSGLNIGYNSNEQTVAPGESITYSWYADEEYGTCLLSSFTDIRNHRYHGLFGAIIIEPEGSIINSNNNIDKYKEQVTIFEKDNTQFREFVLFMHNGIRLLDEKGNLIQTAREEDPLEPVDFEDRGEKGFNYKSERFFNRLQIDPEIANVFSSKVHGDPSTPVLEAFVGEKIIIRLLMPSDKPRATCFILHGHKWRAQLDDPFTRIINAQGNMSVGNVFNIELIPGLPLIVGDYLYRSGVLRWDLQSGMWGILRIKS